MRVGGRRRVIFSLQSVPALGAATGVTGANPRRQVLPPRTSFAKRRSCAFAFRRTRDRFDDWLPERTSLTSVSRKDFGESEPMAAVGVFRVLATCL